MNIADKQVIDHWGKNIKNNKQKQKQRNVITDNLLQRMSSLLK